MNRKLAAGLFTLGLIGVLIWIIFSAALHPAVSTPQIFIRPDGSIAPSSAPLQRDGDTYTFLNTIHEDIIVQKNNIIIDGKGLRLELSNFRSQGGSLWELSNVNNITIRHMAVAARNHLILHNCQFCEIVDTNFSSIILFNSHNNLISENPYTGRLYLENCMKNTVSYNPTGEIELRDSSYNKILNNRITDLLTHAITITSSHNNLIFRNTVSKPIQMWICLSGDSSNNLFVANNVTGPFVIAPVIAGLGTNLFYHNNFVDATARYPSEPITNLTEWDNGSEGNYWSNYNGTDNNHDGIGDTPYAIDENNQDRYPLMNPVNLQQEPQPQLSEPQTETNPIIVITMAIVAVIAVLGIGLATFKRKKLTKVLNQLDQKSFSRAAVSSLLGGIMFVASAFFGFGTYMTFPYRGGYATYGLLHRFTLIFLTALAISLIFTSLGYRKLGKLRGDSLSSYQLLPVAITSIVLASAAGLLSTANPIYIRQSIGPYWGECYFQNTDNSIKFTQLTVIAFTLLGINQILWGTTQLKTRDSATRPGLNLTTGTIQTLSGAAFLTLTIPLYILPFIIRLHGLLPLLPLLFLLTQTLSAIIFLHSNNLHQSREPSIIRPNNKQL